MPGEGNVSYGSILRLGFLLEVSDARVPLASRFPPPLSLSPSVFLRNSTMKTLESPDGMGRPDGYFAVSFFELS